MLIYLLRHSHLLSTDPYTCNGHGSPGGTCNTHSLPRGTRCLLSCTVFPSWGRATPQQNAERAGGGHGVGLARELRHGDSPTAQGIPRGGRLAAGLAVRCTSGRGNERPTRSATGAAISRPTLCSRRRFPAPGTACGLSGSRKTRRSAPSASSRGTVLWRAVGDSFRLR